MTIAQLGAKAKPIKCLDGILSVFKQENHVFVALSGHGKIYEGNVMQVEAFLQGLEFCCQEFGVDAALNNTSKVGGIPK